MKTILFTTILALLYSPNSYANQAGDPARGKQLAEHCWGCHGEFGIAPIESNPNLAGQNAKYLEYALKAYRDGIRKGGNAVIMRANASGLSDQDIRDLASHFSGLPGKGAAKASGKTQ